MSKKQLISNKYLSPTNHGSPNSKNVQLMEKVMLLFIVEPKRRHRHMSEINFVNRIRCYCFFED